MPDPVVHFDFTTADPTSLSKFYEQLFEWQTQSIGGESEYVLIDTRSGAGINGGIMKGDSNATIPYVEVPDLESALNKIEKLGGKTVVPSTSAGPVTFAIFSDPDGNSIGLIKSDPTSETPGVSKGNNSPVDWFEIIGKDAKSLRKFYENAFGWELHDSGATEFDYFMMQPQERGVPGAVGSSPDRQASVRFYARVDDLPMTIKKAESLGAKTIMEPSKVAENTEIAIFEDPQGHHFGIYKGM